MIFIAAGTRDGRELVCRLLEVGYEVTASVVSHYGKQLLEKYGHTDRLHINSTAMDKHDLIEYLGTNDIKAFVDATHPYASNVSENAMGACRSLNIPYIRYERESTPITYVKAYNVLNYEDAAKQAAELGHHIFLTTGSRNLEKFVTSPYLIDASIVVRVLPSSKVISMCESLGLSPGNIIAMQGPFSKELNIELYKKYNADVLVTKNAGHIGGTDTKISAAEAMGIPVVIINRPMITYDNEAHDFNSILKFLHSRGL